MRLHRQEVEAAQRACEEALAEAQAAQALSQAQAQVLLLQAQVQAQTQAQAQAQEQQTHAQAQAHFFQRGQDAESQQQNTAYMGMQHPIPDDSSMLTGGSS
jgi:hypothetical protein